MKSIFKKSLSILFVVLMIFSGINVFAASPSREEIIASLNDALKKTGEIEALVLKYDIDYDILPEDKTHNVIADFLSRNGEAYYEYGKSVNDRDIQEHLMGKMDPSTVAFIESKTEAGKTVITLSDSGVETDETGESHYDNSVAITISMQGYVENVSAVYKSGTEKLLYIIKIHYEVNPIRVRVDNVAVEPKEVTLYCGQEKQLAAIISPDEADYQEVSWTSSNSDIAKVDENGNIIADNRGTAVITVTTVDGKKTAEVTVTVKYMWWQWIIRYLFFGWVFHS